MCQNIFSCTNSMYIDVDSKLSAMATFLRELEGDPAARSLLLTMVDEIRSLLDDGLDEGHIDATDAPLLHRTVCALGRTIEALTVDHPTSDASWQRVRAHHRHCHALFSRFMKQSCTCGKTRRAVLIAAA